MRRKSIQETNQMDQYILIYIMNSPAKGRKKKKKKKKIYI